MAITWKITHIATTQDLATWNVRIADLEFASQVPDTLTVEIVGDVDSTGWSYGDEIVLIKDDGVTPVNWFRGTITSTPRVATGNAEYLVYTVSGPWWQLDNICYKQETGTREDGSDASDAAVLKFTPLCILGQNKLGQKIDTSDQVLDILQYANDAVPSDFLNVGTLFSGIPFNMSKVESITCGDAIRTVLKYHPDVVARFDYTFNPPVLHMQKREDLPAITKSLTDNNIDCEVTSRDDLVPPKVEIVYEITGSVNGKTYKDFEVDIAGPGGTELNAINAVVKLRGDEAQFLSQRLKTKTLPKPSATWQQIALDANDNTPIFGWRKNPDWGVQDAEIAQWNTDAKQFWLEHVEWLEEVHINNWIVVRDSFGMRVINPITDEFPDEDGDGQPDNDPDALPLYTNGFVFDPVNPNAKPADDDGTPKLTLPREVISGHVTPWMQQGSIQVKVGAVLCRALIRYTGPNQNHEFAKKHFPHQIRDEDGDVVGRYAEVEVRINATDGVSKVYQKLQSLTEAEQVPQGIAQAVYDSLSSLQYEGVIVMQEDEVTPDVIMGNQLNISNGPAAWASMNALIQKVNHDIDRGTLTATFGPPQQLSIQDFTELLRFIRLNPVTFVSSKERTEGLVSHASKAAEGAYEGKAQDTKQKALGSPKPFTIDITRYDNGNYYATVEKGFIIQDDFLGGANLPKIYPGLGGVAAGDLLDADPPPILDVTALEDVANVKAYLELTIDVTEPEMPITTAEIKIASGAIPANTAVRSGPGDKEYFHIADVDISSSRPPSAEMLVSSHIYYPTGNSPTVTFQYDPVGTAVPASEQLEFTRGHIVDDTKTISIPNMEDYSEFTLEFCRYMYINDPGSPGCIQLQPEHKKLVVLAKGGLAAPTHGLTDSLSTTDVERCAT